MIRGFLKGGNKKFVRQTVRQQKLSEGYKQVQSLQSTYRVLVPIVLQKSTTKNLLVSFARDFSYINFQKPSGFFLFVSLYQRLSVACIHLS